jgi:Fe-S-cluster formation regulator IscX/YfhJ
VAHRTRSSFYLVAKNVQSRHPEALRAIADWKSTWRNLTFPQSIDEKEVKQQQIDQAHMEIGEAKDLLTSSGRRLLEVMQPVWLIQRDALKNASWLKNKATGPSGHTDGPSASPTSDVLVNNLRLPYEATCTLENPRR